MDPILSYIHNEMLPYDKLEAQRVQEVASKYRVMSEQLYMHLYLGPLLRCVCPKEALRVLEEIYEGYCGNHSGGRSLAHKTWSQGFYWPTMWADI